MSEQVVFIDSSVPDIQDLLDGLKPGEQAFVIDSNSDGLDQIASILKANDLTGLSSISIVGHGASGEIDLGSTAIDDANLASDAAALSTIGASLAPGGNLSLYACDTAAGAAGQQFIADLSAYAGGVDVAAATHLVGSSDLGGSWTLDASTGPAAAPATVPFSDQALANFQGTLSALAVTAGATATFNGGGAAQPLDPGLTVTDASSTTLVSAAVRILGFTSGDTLNFTDTAHITGSYNANIGVLTLSGTDTVADYQAALRSITYSFSGSGDPTIGGADPSRVITWAVSDGSTTNETPSSINNDQPTLGLNQLVVLDGVFPSTTDSNPGIIPMGALVTFAGNFAWGGTAQADGQSLSISQYTALFSILGTMYGGNGTSTFGLPNLQGQLAVGYDNNPNAALGQTYGSDNVTLTAQNLPPQLTGSNVPFSNDQPSLTVNYLINTSGAFPGSNSTDVLGEVVPFLGNFAPAGYMLANGQLLAISQYSALFAVIGTTYGGNGTTTFALPNLTGSTIIGAGTDAGGTVALGTTTGQDQISLSMSNLPVPEGSNQAISNSQPSVALTYLIATQGLFPSSSGSAPSNTFPYLGEIIAFAGTAGTLSNMLASGRQRRVWLGFRLDRHFGRLDRSRFGASPGSDRWRRVLPRRAVAFGAGGHRRWPDRLQLAIAFAMADRPRDRPAGLRHQGVGQPDAVARDLRRHFDRRDQIDRLVRHGARPGRIPGDPAMAVVWDRRPGLWPNQIQFHHHRSDLGVPAERSALRQWRVVERPYRVDRRRRCRGDAGAELERQG
jgi:microcystin-dependent protein